jgi:hypothetical protein
VLRILLLTSLLISEPAFAASTSGKVNVAVTITRIPQAPVRFYGSRFTQGAASISVSRAGFSNIQPLGQAGTIYYFSGVRRGRLYEVAVSVSNGRIMQVTAV